jgi:hypothetical protein
MGAGRTIDNRRDFEVTKMFKRVAVLPLVLLENPRPKGGILTKGERPFSISR